MPEKPKSGNEARIDELTQNVTARKAAPKEVTDDNVKERKQREIDALENQIKALKAQKP